MAREITSSENQRQENVLEEIQQLVEEETPLRGDLLVEIISRLPTINLVPSSYVSRSWEHAVISCLRNPSRAKPWLIIHMQNRRNLSLVISRAYDPDSNVWIEFTGPQSTTTYTSSLQSSNSNMLYMLKPSKLSFSTDPLHIIWHEVVPPRVWRTDPTVAIVGSYLVVAGGAYDFEEDPLAVELYDMASPGNWSRCQPLPVVLRNAAAASWLSVAVLGHKMYLLDKHSGTLCSFDANKKIWSEICSTLSLHPNPSIYFSVFGFAGERLILVGLMGDSEDPKSLGIWEVDINGFDCEEIGKMPQEIFERLKSVNPMLSSIDVSLAENFIYMYHSSSPGNIFFLDLNVGACEWGSVRSSFLDDRVLMDMFVFTCSKVGLNDLRKAFTLASGNFSVQLAEKIVLDFEELSIT
ncbi:hypothetical protein C5167_015848 [Papaver somniferum]|uniref:F-box domain-containing protein n=1 Tax=Papaver somniferum TaxID=3469 RepID=A0A4Y7J798_PAPSO|nr:F-box/kelch-repeat protein At1g23390-like [Papaver somniferum]RZC57004.1 hypothetical protein C5167_015848 [Papaver somniferum]